MSQCHAPCEHDVSHLALQTLLGMLATRVDIVGVEEVVQGHGELQQGLSMFVHIHEGEVKAPAAFQHVLVFAGNRPTATGHHVVEDSGLKLVILPTDDNTGTGLEVEAAHVVFRVLVDDFLALVVGTAIEA